MKQFKIKKKLAVSFYVKQWLEEMPQFGKFIYIALPWHYIVEQCGMLRQNYEPLRLASGIFEILQFKEYDHFTVIGQASLRQIQKYSRRGGFEFPNLDKLKLIFTARLENIDRVAKGENLKLREVPIPLLHPRMMEIPFDAFKSNKEPFVFFSGACSSPVRKFLHKLSKSNLYNMTGIRSCDERRLSRYEFYTEMAKATWVLTPRGSYPAAYMMSEALQCGSLPIYIYGWRDNCTKALPSINSYVPFFPFYNMGIDWRDLGLLINADEIQSIPRRLSRIDPQSRLNNVLRLQSLFSLQGTFRYMLVVLSHVAAGISSVKEHLPYEARGNSTS